MESEEFLEAYANMHDVHKDVAAVPLDLVCRAFRQFFALKKHSMEVLADEKMTGAVDTALGRLTSQKSTRGSKKRKAKESSGMSPDAKRTGKSKENTL